MACGEWMPTLGVGNHLALELGNQVALKLGNDLTPELGNHLTLKVGNLVAPERGNQLALRSFIVGNIRGPRHLDLVAAQSQVVFEVTEIFWGDGFGLECARWLKVFEQQPF